MIELNFLQEIFTILKLVTRPNDTLVSYKIRKSGAKIEVHFLLKKQFPTT